jgi:uracil-DNA glycosylase
MGPYVDVLASLREYLLFLSENGIREISCSVGRYLRVHPYTAETELAEISRKTSMNLEEVRRELGDCKRCRLAGTRQHIVFGEGEAGAEILFVGEGPGEDEDLTGRPFVGRAGKLLTQIIENGMKIRRSSVYIGNIVKCRPPGNRVPREDEVAACRPFLLKQIEAIGPRVIVTLGRPAACALLGLQESMSRLRGTWYAYKDIPVMPTFHPSYVLRRYTEEVRRQVYEDMLEVLRRLRTDNR